ncbi:MAG: ATP-binding protein [Eubacterium sp.]|nr:ATP-binding protein [Eubacterium sp.]
MKELVVDAKLDNLNQVLAFLDEWLEEHECPMKAQMQIDIAVEEMYVNIAHYAYTPNVGQATIRLDAPTDAKGVEITLIDRGIPYNPLAKEDPDVSLSAEQRQIGGLGIFMVKKSMDSMLYEYTDGQNILTMRKDF